MLLFEKKCHKIKILSISIKYKLICIKFKADFLYWKILRNEILKCWSFWYSLIESSGLLEYLYGVESLICIRKFLL